MIGWIAHMAMSSMWMRWIMVGLAVLAGVKIRDNLKVREGRAIERTASDVRNLEQMRRMQDAGQNTRRDRRGLIERMRGGKF